MPVADLDGVIVKCTGLITAIVMAGVTIIKLKSSKGDESKITQSPPAAATMPPEAIELIRRLTDSSHLMQLDIKVLSVNLEHLTSGLMAIEKRVDEDHMMIKLLRDAIIAWGGLDAVKPPLRPDI